METLLPPMNPEVARLRRQSSQRKYRKRLRYVRVLWAIAGLLLLAFLIEVVLAFSISPRFWIYRIKVAGTETLTKPEVIRLIGLPARSNFYRVSLGKLADRIRREPRVERAAVQRDVMGSLRVDIYERQAVCRIGYTIPPLYLDRYGVAFTRPVGPKNPVPVIEGVTVRSIKHAIGKRQNSPRIRQALACLARLQETGTTQSSPEVVRLVMAPNEWITLVLRQGTKVYLGEPKDFAAKFWVMHNIIGQASAEGYALGEIDYIELKSVTARTDIGAYMPKAKQETIAP